MPTLVTFHGEEILTITQLQNYMRAMRIWAIFISYSKALAMIERY